MLHCIGVKVHWVFYCLAEFKVNGIKVLTTTALKLSALFSYNQAVNSLHIFLRQSLERPETSNEKSW